MHWSAECLEKTIHNEIGAQYKPYHLKRNMNASMEDKASYEWFKQTSNQGLKPDEVLGTKELSYKIGATKVVLPCFQLRKIKSAAEVIVMCKLNVLGLFEHWFI